MALTIVDAGVLIGFLDRNDLHHQAAADALAATVHRGDRVVIASSALAEVLVGPSRQGRHAVAVVLERMADGTPPASTARLKII